MLSHLTTDQWLIPRIARWRPASVPGAISGPARLSLAVETRARSVLPRAINDHIQSQAMYNDAWYTRTYGMLNDRPINPEQTTQHTGENMARLVDQHAQPEEYGSLGSTVRELLETVLFILLIFFIVRGLVQNFRIDGSSMEPNLHNDQYILVNKVLFFHFDSNAPLRLLPGSQDIPAKMIYPLRTPQRGDVVVLEAPPTDYDGTTKDYIKRVIGLPGETVLVRDSKVFINGHELDEPYLAPGQRTDCGTGGLCQPYVVPPNTVVVMGDNRSSSQDSRSWNAEPGLPLERVVGRAWVSYWPYNNMGVIPAPSYAADAP
jgi:signal peptidase I